MGFKEIAAREGYGNQTGTRAPGRVRRRINTRKKPMAKKSGTQMLDNAMQKMGEKKPARKPAAKVAPKKAAATPKKVVKAKGKPAAKARGKAK